MEAARLALLSMLGLLRLLVVWGRLGVRVMLVGGLLLLLQLLRSTPRRALPLLVRASCSRDPSLGQGWCKIEHGCGDRAGHCRRCASSCSWVAEGRNRAFTVQVRPTWCLDTDKHGMLDLLERVQLYSMVNFLRLQRSGQLNSITLLIWDLRQANTLIREKPYMLSPCA